MNHAMFFTQAVVARHQALLQTGVDRDRLMRRSGITPHRRVGTTHALRTLLERRHQTERATAPAGVAVIS